jgi:hypothetical protein
MKKIVITEPFRVISNVTDCVYTVREVEINKKGIIENYIIDGRAWSPSRFRGNKPLCINSVCMEPLENVLPARGTIEDELYNIMASIHNIIKKIEDKEE